MAKDVNIFRWNLIFHLTTFCFLRLESSLFAFSVSPQNKLAGKFPLESLGSGGAVSG